MRGRTAKRGTGRVSWPLVVCIAAIAAAAPCQEPPAAGEPAAAALSITTTPEGAEVSLDGRIRGKTPLRLADVPAGEHRLRLLKPGFLENSRPLSLEAGASEAIHQDLTPDAAPAPEGRGLARKALLIGVPTLAAAGTAGYVPNRNGAPTLGGVSAEPAATVGVVWLTPFRFSAQGAADPDRDALAFTWGFGDGTLGAGPAVSHVFVKDGTFQVKLDVRDGRSTASAAALVRVASLSGSWRGALDTCPQCTFEVTLSQRGTHFVGTFSGMQLQGPIDGALAQPRQVRFTTADPRYRAGQWSGSLSDDAQRITGSVSWWTETMTFTLTRR